MEWTMGIIFLCVMYDLINLQLSEREYGKTVERMVNSELAHPNHLRCRSYRLPQVCKDVSTQSVEARQDNKIYVTIWLIMWYRFTNMKLHNFYCGPDRDETFLKKAGK